MRKAQYAAWQIGFAIFLILIGFAIFTVLSGAGLFGIANLGEEGFQPYDLALSSDSWSPSLWNLPAITPTTKPVCSRQITSNCFLGPEDPREKLTGQNGNLIIQGGYNNYLDGNSRSRSQDLQVTTRNLYLQDLRFEYTIVGGEDTYSCINKATLNNIEFNCKETGSIDLRWDDYNTSHYQLFKNNKLIEEGTTTNRDYRLNFNVPGIDWKVSPVTITLEKPRYKQVFGCDPKKGETLVTDACFGGPNVISLNDLEDFNRFCLDFEAKNCIDGICKSSNRVYYALAQGQSVPIENNEAWTFSYIADGQKGSDFTIQSKCEEPIKQENKIDIDDFTKIEGNRKIVWNANFENPSLDFEGVEHITAITPTYTCQSTDNHDSNDMFSYPYPQESCYKFSITQNEEFWESKFLTKEARITYDSSTDLFGQVAEPSHWQARIESTLVKNPFKTQDLAIDGENIRISILSTYDQKTPATITVTYNPNVLKDIQTENTADIIVPGNNEVSVPLDNRFIGKTSAQITIYMRTEAGNVQASETVFFQYDNTEDGIDQESLSEPSLWSKIKSWFNSIWESIKGFFGG